MLRIGDKAARRLDSALLPMLLKLFKGRESVDLWLCVAIKEDSGGEVERGRRRKTEGSQKERERGERD